MEIKHPKYYKELRKLRNNLDQVTETSKEKKRSPGPGVKLQASSPKPQAEESSKRQASSPKRQASSFKPEATSSMIREPRNI